MGEYAKRLSTGERTKIGTCENMYYLRYNQRGNVEHEPGNVDPNNPKEAAELRFRFPWPDEDGAELCHEGAFERSLPIPGMKSPPGVEHYPVQFSARPGYLVSLPCPESRDADWIRQLKDDTAIPISIGRNGFQGAVHLAQQRPTEDGQTLRAIFKCGGCGAKWRAETWADAEPYVVALRAEVDADRSNPPDARLKDFHAIADRIAAGYGH